MTRARWNGARPPGAWVDEVSLYDTPGTATQPLPFLPQTGPPAFPAAIGDVLHEWLTRCWSCGRRYGPLGNGFHVCWTGRLHCELCNQLHPAICDDGRRRVADHECPVIKPFLDEARRLTS